MKTPLPLLVKFILFALLTVENANSQQLEIYSGSGPAGNGPATSPAASSFYLNTGTSTTFSAYSPAITYKVAFTNQQYTSGTPGLTVGVQNSGATATAIGSDVLQDKMNANGSPSSTQYTSDPFGTAGTNFDVANNYGYKLNTDVYFQLGQPANARNYYGDLVITFSRPVCNPVLHFAGLGAATLNGSGVYSILGYYTEFEMSAANVAAGITLTKLSGTTYFNITSTKILNSSTAKQSTSSGSTSMYSSQSSNASGGSVRVNTNGTAITSISFGVYLRGDGGNGGPAVQWAGAVRSGDGYLLSASLAMYNISGNIYDDANGLTDNTVNGTGTNAGASLYANLVDASGNFFASSAVAAGGSYSFSGIVASNYSIVLSKVSGATVSSLPTGWVNTGENTGTGSGSDGTADGVLSVSLSSANVTNANFGIDQKPLAANQTYVITSPVYGNMLTLNGTGASNSPGLLAGTDAEDGSLGSGNTFSITSISGMYGNLLYYNGVQITGATTITAYNPSLLKVKFLGPGSSTLSFGFSSKDAAGVTSVSATYTISWLIALPVSLLNFTADASANNTVLLQWQINGDASTVQFVIEHSTDGSDFKTIGQVEAKTGGNTQTAFSWLHNTAATGMNYYRLKLMDNDGQYSYSGIRLEKINTTADKMIVAPNPAGSFIQVRLPFLPDAAIHIQIHNAAGELVKTIAAGQNQIITVQLTELPAAAYYIEVLKQGAVYYREKFLKL